MDYGGAGSQWMLMNKRSAVSIFLAASIEIFLVGCGQDVTLSAESGETLCISYYQQCIDPLFSKSFALAGGGTIQCINCHAGGPGKSFQINAAPASELEWLGNFESARLQSLEGVNSKMLLRPLGVNHGIGPQVFAGTGDPDYQRILYWIMNPVDSRGSIDPLQDTAQCQAIYAANPCP
ncbi:MAG: hypothetical protein OEM95_12010 [Gammaproteobacteria bacterium]|nr:hypothetical protein [Gammaproteobacteria bacterium]MDH5487876.1 hypothetical protein [Gammaproteobacteria bacterium]